MASSTQRRTYMEKTLFNHYTVAMARLSYDTDLRWMADITTAKFAEVLDIETWRLRQSLQKWSNDWKVLTCSNAKSSKSDRIYYAGDAFADAAIMLSHYGRKKEAAKFADLSRELLGISADEAEKERMWEDRDTVMSCAT
ncbi:hypothetical protein LTR37_013759 [Vermiconidia calcicola]|uniref:Uncharacterized protein n=1 Tax=Vermiconidia calcicola TaxID=1690605 RepID=A0ACC3MVN1_9PEZI|nr:hypothetical protein LTR37_013759 [Vermiconidia calcicola]